MPLDRMRRTCRRRPYSDHTEKAYVRGIVRYVRFHDTTHPRRLDADDVRAFSPGDNRLVAHFLWGGL